MRPADRGSHGAGSTRDRETALPAGVEPGLAVGDCSPPAARSPHVPLPNHTNHCQPGTARTPESPTALRPPHRTGLGLEKQQVPDPCGNLEKSPGNHTRGPSRSPDVTRYRTPFMCLLETTSEQEGRTGGSQELRGEGQQAGGTRGSPHDRIYLDCAHACILAVTPRSP